MCRRARDGVKKPSAVLHPSDILSRCARLWTSHSRDAMWCRHPHYVFPTSYDELLRITAGEAAEIGG